MNNIMEITPELTTPDRDTAMNIARINMQQSGCWSVHQQMGRRWPVGCVALEITQRCNLDCSLCYLSGYSEFVKDIPLDEIISRINKIYSLYGAYTDIQVTGGDPTLRKRDELIAIIRHINKKGMRSTLMTNGIRATRSLLKELAAAGLDDVAFHVDTTQKRKGYANEKELNAIRREYINRTKGLGISVMFNTTVHKNNFDEIPGLVKFFVENAGHIRTVSFQLQADTGRGTERKRAEIITPDSVWQQIESAVRTPLNHNAIKAGHHACNRYGMGLVINKKVHDLLDDTEFIGKLHAETAEIIADRKKPHRTVFQFMKWLYKHPQYLPAVHAWIYKKFRLVTHDLFKSRGRLTTLSFLIHNFMDARDLDNKRIDACIFKTITSEGPVSMCLYNARRNHHILKPVFFADKGQPRYWYPLTGKFDDSPRSAREVSLQQFPVKFFKGRFRPQPVDPLFKTD